MSQKNDPQRPNVEGNAKSPLDRLKGSVQHYVKPFDPVDSENWEADLLEPNNAVRPGEVPTHIAPTGTRYIRLRVVPQSLQDSFERYLTGAGCPVVDNEDGPLAFETDWIEWRQHHRPDRIAAHMHTTFITVCGTGWQRRITSWKLNQWCITSADSSSFGAGTAKMLRLFCLP